MFPEYEILLFLVLPIRMKWLGGLTAAYLGFEFVTGNWGIRGAILAALANYFLFFSGAPRRRGPRHPTPEPTGLASRGFRSAAGAVGTARACAICGSKEVDGADIRVCGCDKCREANAGAPRELCVEHARNH